MQKESNGFSLSITELHIRQLFSYKIHSGSKTLINATHKYPDSLWGHIYRWQFWRLSLTCTELSTGKALAHTHHININGAGAGRQIKWCELSG